MQLENWLTKIKESAVVQRLRGPKAPLYVALVVAVLAVLLYVAIGGVSCDKKTTVKNSSHTQLESSLSAILSEIEGAGETEVLVTTDSKGALVGVVVVSSGATDNYVVAKLMRAVATATGATPDQIDIFVRK